MKYEEWELRLLLMSVGNATDTGAEVMRISYYLSSIPDILLSIPDIIYSLYSVILQFRNKLAQCFSRLFFLHKAFTNEETTEAGTA